MNNKKYAEKQNENNVYSSRNQASKWLQRRKKIMMRGMTENKHGKIVWMGGVKREWERERPTARKYQKNYESAKQECRWTAKFVVHSSTVFDVSSRQKCFSLYLLISHYRWVFRTTVNNSKLFLHVFWFVILFDFFFV